MQKHYVHKDNANVGAIPSNSVISVFTEHGSLTIKTTTGMYIYAPGTWDGLFTGTA